MDCRLRDENRELLRKLGTVVYLQVKPDTVLERLKGDHTRPMLQGGDAGERVRSLLEYRTPLYQKAADLVVDDDDKTVSGIAGENHRIIVIVAEKERRES